MAADCVLLRTLKQGAPVLCRDVLHVVDVRRYTRDQGSAVYFPQAVPEGAYLYDITLTDGDCRVQVTLDPGLNRLVDKGVLRPGLAVQNAAFSPSVTAVQLPACPGACGESGSFRLMSVEPRDDGGRKEDAWDTLPWFGCSQPAGPLVPLRANRSVFLPLWNNVDYSGEAWAEAPPTEEDPEDEEDDEGRRPGVTVAQLKEHFLSGCGRVTGGAVELRLIGRIVNKSHLMYYGKTDRKCECPYKAVLEVCDPTGSVSVVLWNSVCVRWYRCLRPGDIISLRRYRVKPQYQAGPHDVELSLNSRNPAAHIALLPPASLPPAHLPAPPTYTFCNSQELLRCADGSVCDVIGLLTFPGRSERIRNGDGKGAELLQYRWLRLEDGASKQPIMVKLFSTSQPEVHLKLHPMSVVVCCRVKVTRCGDQHLFLTNTMYTQVYCTGLGHHTHMSYRKLPAVRRFVRWMRRQEDEEVLSRVLMGGFFLFPPPPVSMEAYLRGNRGDPGFLRGAELQRDVQRLCYRERSTFCVQAIVTVVTYSRKGEEDCCLFWTDRAAAHAACSSSSSSSSSSSCCSTALSPRTPDRSQLKRKQQLSTDTHNKRSPRVTLQQDQTNQTVVLFEASREFLDNVCTDEEEEEEEEEEAACGPAPLQPIVLPIAMETLPMRYDYHNREEQAVAMAIGGWADPGRFDAAVPDYFTLRLRAVSDGVEMDTFFLPHTSSSSSSHANTWLSILSHGAFSSDSPPPSGADLVAMAPQLANQRLACVLEACRMGGGRTELVLSRAFRLGSR